MNEASQIVVPDRVVKWASLKLDSAVLRGALAQLEQEPHVLARCPLIGRLITDVAAKMLEQPIRDLRAAHNLFWWEAECILACPPRP